MATGDDITGADGSRADSRAPLVARSTPASSLLNLALTRSHGRINLVLLDFEPKAVFAGVKTALEAGVVLGVSSHRDVQLVMLNQTGRVGPEREAIIQDGVAWLDSHFGEVTWQIVCDDDLRTATFGERDVWVATHWMTAHAIDRAAKAGLIDASQVLYLIQDYEPDFFASSLDRSTAESTYTAGFIPVVNTRQVAAYLEKRGLGAVDRSLVFAPRFDSKQLMITAARREKPAQPTVFFYGRPSKPRNMFELGLATLRDVASKLADRGVRADFVMAGEDGPDIDLGEGITLRNLGLLGRPEYFATIAHVDVGLTLQATPHPSHLPFDLAISGVPAVTNEVDGSRNSMHPRIIAAEGNPAALSSALINALLATRRGPACRSGYLPVRDGQLGVPLPTALAAALATIPL